MRRRTQVLTRPRAMSAGATPIGPRPNELALGRTSSMAPSLPSARIIAHPGRAPTNTRARAAAATAPAPLEEGSKLVIDGAGGWDGDVLLGHDDHLEVHVTIVRAEASKRFARAAFPPVAHNGTTDLLTGGDADATGGAELQRTLADVRVRRRRDAAARCGARVLADRRHGAWADEHEERPRVHLSAARLQREIFGPATEPGALREPLVHAEHRAAGGLTPRGAFSVTGRLVTSSR